MDNLQASQATEQDPPPEVVSRWYGRPDNQGQLQWSTSTNDSEELSDLLARTSSIPIIHRFAMKQGIWETDSITIQDPYMRKILKAALQEYQGLDLKKEEWTFQPPFQPLVHRWDKIEGYPIKPKSSPKTENALARLVSVLFPIIKPLLSSSKDIAFANIQYIFPPGTLVFARELDVETVSRVVECQKKYNKWEIHVENVDWDGEICGYQKSSFKIDEFGGYRQVTELKMFPISYLADEPKVRATLIERGRKYEQLRGYRFMACRKECRVNKYGRRFKKPAGSKICVDAYEYYCNNGKAKEPQLRPLEYNGKLPVEAGAGGLEIAPESCLQPLTDEQRLIIDPWLKCFDLQTKEWCKVLIDDLEDVIPDGLAFEKLHLPDNEKNVLLNLVKGKLLSRNLGNNDPTQNQGRGLTCLMFGPTGVGKTFTAKAIADKLGLPLYSVIGREPGIECPDIEVYVEQGPALCSSWNGILLIEDADCLITAKESESITYDEYEFVPAFLQALKEYTGIVFLTTNEVRNIGSALRSRIDYFMPYSSPCIQVRRQIWRDLIEDSGKDSFIRSSEDMDEVLSELSKFNLNGHEINNIVNSARMIALGSEDTDNKVSLDTLCLLAHNCGQCLRP